MGKRINMQVPKDDRALIVKIMLRAAAVLNFESRGCSRLEVSMDLTACHANACALDLKGLLAAEDFDFIHDVTGIMRHIDRRTGQLGQCFIPRYAQREVVGS